MRLLLASLAQFRVLVPLMVDRGEALAAKAVRNARQRPMSASRGLR